MNYELNDRGRTLEIADGEYNDISRAHSALVLIGGFTENYRVVLDAYGRIEETLHMVALENLLHGGDFYSKVRRARVKLNSSVIGYLAAARYFLDSSAKILKEVCSADDLVAFDKSVSDVYDRGKEYRFIEALRNYVQHRALPVDGLWYNNYVEDIDKAEDSEIVTSLTLFAEKKKLAEDEKFKKSALINMPEKIDIIYCIRSHMSAIWEVHAKGLELLRENAENSRRVIQVYIDKLTKVVGGPPVNPLAIDDNPSVGRPGIPLFLGWDDERVAFLKSNMNLGRLRQWYISGKTQRPASQ